MAPAEHRLDQRRQRVNGLGRRSDATESPSAQGFTDRSTVIGIVDATRHDATAEKLVAVVGAARQADADTPVRTVFRLQLDRSQHVARAELGQISQHKRVPLRRRHRVRNVERDHFAFGSNLTERLASDQYERCDDWHDQWQVSWHGSGLRESSVRGVERRHRRSPKASSKDCSSREEPALWLTRSCAGRGNAVQNGHGVSVVRIPR